MNEALATLRQPDATDIEAVLSLFEEIGDRYSRDEINKLLAAGLRNRLHPDNTLDEKEEAGEPASYEEGVSSIDTPTDAPGVDLVCHTTPLPAHLGTGNLRTFMIHGHPWFAASDLAKPLGYRDARDMVRMLDEDEADTHKVRMRSANGVAQLREILIVSESGLYTVIFNSRRDTAKPFRRWITNEVLPSIARTGGYQDTEGAMGEHLRAATDGKVGVAPQAPSATPGLPADLQLLLALALPMLAELAPHLQGWLAAWLDKRTRVLLPRTRPAYAGLPFYDLLNGRCKLFGRTFVARELGVSLPQISQVLNFSGRYGDGCASPIPCRKKCSLPTARPRRCTCLCKRLCCRGCL